MEMDPQNPSEKLETTSDNSPQETKTKKASKPRKTTKQTILVSESEQGGSNSKDQSNPDTLAPSDGIPLNPKESTPEKPKRKRTKKTEDRTTSEPSGSESNVSDVPVGGSAPVGEDQAVGSEKKPRKPRKSSGESGEAGEGVDSEKKPRKPRKSSIESPSEDTEKERKEREEKERKEREEKERKEREEKERKEREEKERKEREEKERKEREEKERKEREEKERKEREEKERLHSDGFDASELRITRFPSYLLDRMDKKARNILTFSLNKINAMNMRELGICIDELTANKSFYDPQFNAEKDLYFHIIKLIKYLEKRLKEEEEKNAQRFFRHEFIDPYHDGKFNKLIKKCNNDPANSAWEIVEKMGRKVQAFPFNEGVLRKWIEEFLRERLQQPPRQ